MTINRIGSSENTTAYNAANLQNASTDAYTKNIQQQIANAQKELQDLSSNDKMSEEDKMKKRQEIQQEIMSLQQQLRQYQIEQRQEQQAQNASADDVQNDSNQIQKSEESNSGLSGAGMQAMISAGTSMKQAKVQGSVYTEMEGKAGVLRSEIKLDQSRGAGTERKEAELTDVTGRMQGVRQAQMSTLADASDVMEKAAKADRAKLNKFVD